MTNQEAVVILNKITATVEEERAIKKAIKVLEQEPCEDAVSRKHLLDMYENHLKSGWHLTGEQVIADIENVPSILPSVQPQTVDWDAMIKEVKEVSLGKWYVGRTNGKSDEVVLTEMVIEIINKYRKGA